MSNNSENQSKMTVDKKIFGDPIKDTSPSALRELLEKNLKWSQIIYEQNRRLNSKLVWSLVANWLRLCIILIPLILGILFLPNIIKNFRSKYNILTPTSGQTTSSLQSVEEIIKAFNNLDPLQKGRLNELLK